MCRAGSASASRRLDVGVAGFRRVAFPVPPPPSPARPARASSLRWWLVGRSPFARVTVAGRFSFRQPVPPTPLRARCGRRFRLSRCHGEEGCGEERRGECRGVVGSARPRVPVLCVCGRVPDHRWGGLAARVPVPPARLRSVARARASADPRAPSSLSLPTPSLPGFARASYLVDPASSICLSQRLSHACLSTHGRYSETANGSLNQLWFLWSLAPLLLG